MVYNLKKSSDQEAHSEHLLLEEHDRPRQEGQRECLSYLSVLILVPQGQDLIFFPPEGLEEAAEGPGEGSMINPGTAQKINEKYESVVRNVLLIYKKQCKCDNRG